MRGMRDERGALFYHLAATATALRAFFYISLAEKKASRIQNPENRKFIKQKPSEEHIDSYVAMKTDVPSQKVPDKTDVERSLDSSVKCVIVDSLFGHWTVYVSYQLGAALTTSKTHLNQKHHNIAIKYKFISWLSLV